MNTNTKTTNKSRVLFGIFLAVIFVASSVTLVLMTTNTLKASADTTQSFSVNISDNLVGYDATGQYSATLTYLSTADNVITFGLDIPKEYAQYYAGTGRRVEFVYYFDNFPAHDNRQTLETLYHDLYGKSYCGIYSAGITSFNYSGNVRGRINVRLENAYKDTCSNFNISGYDIEPVVGQKLTGYIGILCVGQTTDDPTNGAIIIPFGTVDFNTEPEVPTKDGYTFTGWFVDEACTEPYTGTNITGDLTLYAGWKANSYTIKFNGNGNTSGSMSDLAMTYDVAKDLPTNTFTKTGYTFQGWATSSTGAVVYNDGASVNNLSTTDGDTVNLYAVWSANRYRIRFNGNGSTSGSMSILEMSYDTAKNLPSNKFVRTGYQFDGWATSPTGDVVYSDGQSVNNLTTSAETYIDLYAHWNAQIYTIAFNSNGGNGTMENQILYKDIESTLSPNAFTRVGYTFQGWATSSTGAVIYDNEDSILNVAEVGSSLEIYAVWKANTYTIKFVGNGSTSGSMSDLVMTYDVAKNLSANLFVREGYTFQGWATSADSDFADCLNEEEVNNLTATANGEVTLYAVWKINLYKVTFIVDGVVWKIQTVEHGTPASEVITNAVDTALYEVDEGFDSKN